MSELIREMVEVNAFIEGDEENLLLAVEAEGLAATTGWTNVRLEPHTYIDAPEDGFQDFDLVGDRPAEAASTALTPVEAGWEGPLDGWVIGVRIHAIDNLVEQELFDFEEEDETDSEAA